MVFILDESPLDSPVFVLDGQTQPIVGGNGILVEIKGVRISDNLVTMFRFGSDGYNHPSAPSFYDPRLVQPLLFRRDMFAGNTTGGQSRVSHGEIVLANDDGELDDMRQYGLTEITMLIGDLRYPYDEQVPFIKGRILQALFSFRDLTIQLRDRLADFTQPVQTNKYLGTNVLPDGVEGLEDIKGRPKPLIFGRVQNVTPPCVNTSKLVYQLNDGFVEATAVYDTGALLTKGADYTDLADMMAVAPGAGIWRAWPAGGYFRLGASSQGTITADAADRASDVENTAAQVALRIAARPPSVGQVGISDADVVWADVVALDTANSSVVGIWVPDENQFGSLLDAIMTSVGAWYGFDRLGMFRMARLDEPFGGGVITLRTFTIGNDAAINDYDIIDCRFLPTNDPDRGQPTYEVTLDYSRNYTVQNATNVAGVVTDDRRNFLALAVRTATATDLLIKTPFPNSLQKKLTTLLIDPVAAQTEANRQLALFKPQRNFVEIDTPFISDLLNIVDIGSIVTVIMPRFEFDVGKPMRVIGMQYNYLAGIITLSLWG